MEQYLIFLHQITTFFQRSHKLHQGSVHDGQCELKMFVKITVWCIGFHLEKEIKHPSKTFSLSILLITLTSYGRNQSAYFPNDELPLTVSVRISVDWRKKDICLSFISNLYLQKSLWRHQQDWTAKSFSRLIIFPFCYCVLCISAQWCRYHRLLCFSVQSVVVCCFFIVFSYFLHHTGAVKWPIVKEQTVCVWDISSWFSGTLAWRIARQKSLNNNWFATCSLRLSSSSFMFL